MNFHSLLNTLNESEMTGDELAFKAIHFFGLTTDYRECGYILRHRKRTYMIDLSGKHEHNGYEKQMIQTKFAGEVPQHVLKRGQGYDDLRGQRFTDHREVNEFFEYEESGAAMIEFMAKTGAIRVMQDVGFSVVNMPSYRALSLAIEGHRSWYHETSLTVDVLGNNGQHVASKEMSNRVQTAGVEKWLKAVLSGKIA